MNVLSRSVHDYQFGNKIGEGSYSTVYSAIDIHTNKTFAIKVLSKKHIVKENKIKYVNIEKQTLHRLGQQHPGIVQLYYTFQDESSLFFVLDFAEYGELLSIIRKYGSLSEQVTRFYMCQLIDAVLFIHLKGVIHRDLKPENILVGYDFNLKITDFGAAKLLDIDEEPQSENIDYRGLDELNGPVPSNDSNTANNNNRRGSFVGTAEYVSPELLRDNVCGFEADVWALGCILYQFFNGIPPFKGATEYLTFEKIVHVNYSYRQNYPLPPGAIEIIDKILVDNISKRLTIGQLKEMPWFQGIPWDNKGYIWNRKVPRFEPYTPTPNHSGGSPMAPAGLKKAVNKSASYQKLHAQIQNSSDYSFIPAVGSAKRAYAPPTIIKKNPQMTNNNNNVMSNNFKPSIQPMHQFTQSPKHKLGPDPFNQQMTNNCNNNDNNPSSNKDPPSPQKPGSRNIRHKTVFSNVIPPPNLQKSLPPIDHLRIDNTTKQRSPQAAKASSSSQVSKAPASQVPKAPASQVPKAPASQVPKAPASQVPKAPSELPKAPSSAKKSVVAAAAAAGAVQHPYQQLKQNSFIPVKSGISKNIKLKEISSLLDANEKILKMDVILKLDLSHKVVHRKPNEPLGDSSIEAIIKKHKSELKSLAKPVITVITNHARVLFIDSTLLVMLIDLKANQGADYLMYDYEFESLMLSDDENDQSVEANGYLILELNKEGGDLIFLKRILSETKLKETIMVVDKNGKELVLGGNIGWIDCLLLAKDIIQKTPQEKQQSKSNSTNSNNVVPKPKTTTTTTTTTKKTSTNDGNTRSKSPLLMTPRMAQNSSNSSSNGLGSSSSMSKFAYAAAAAAHKY
ncbi:uncharacterized protein KQ657_002645 [Scheffersomyces spartinae]|uniref:non-specific serine/threonine protein kinase n=1 Tax=Scheffersomyces spartinae TaxID=45513 RepID=A0A9P7V5P9_9ASCO|nr:uncharacterized protein KQ657_002645 [Scheffersomyces spartinae]KAG7191856.1 hypothetical protein KQ657_002645 [Scheffersomyces spartinae]